jgi:regulator of sigma E protease
MDSVLIFIVVLGILVFFHELGHFLIARLFGVGVEKFSLGFGPRILGKTINRTDYRVSLIPLGGYVKMVGDEPNAPLDPADIPISFTHKHVAKRSLIVAAGPLFNILLAIVIFTIGLYATGLQSIRPVVKSIESGSPAELAGIQEGDLIRQVNGSGITSWRGIDAALDQNQGEPLQLSIERNGNLLTKRVDPILRSAKDILGEPISYYDIGIKGYKELSAVVDEVVKGLPADQAGLRHGDIILAINAQPVERWETMQEIVAQSQGRPLDFKVRRGNEILGLTITPDSIQERDLLGTKQNVYRIGIRRANITIPEEDLVTIELAFFPALSLGLEQTWNVTKMTGQFLVKMVQQKVPKEAIGGPIRIAQMAQKEAEEGVLRLFYFIAIISVNLALLNLLPIPVLDGGHLLFFGIEAIQRKPVSTKTREMAQQVGILLLLLLMIFVFYNDISVAFF